MCLKHCNNSKALIEYSDDMDYIYENIDEYNLNKKLKILFAFDDMIADMLNNKKVKQIGTELWMRGRKLRFSVFFYCSENY